MDRVYEVHNYSIDNLQNIIADKSGNLPDTIKNKIHLTYFEGYFDYIKAQTIVVENNYIDHDYLEDYAAYYVRCFVPYPKTCTRLHFFKIKFDTSNFEKLLSSEKCTLDCSTLKRDYIGFVVIKPLPDTVIGRTCLTTYPTEGRRNFPITRDYHASLFGIKLEVKTLAFQEQDQTVAACATSALWSVFQGTGKLFQHLIPSPVEITKAATDQFPIESRTIPNNGLTLAMMAGAIRNVNLEPFQLNVEDEYVLKSTLYAYLKGRIPMILGIELFDTSTNESMENHAISVTGFSINNKKPSALPGSNFYLHASRINKMYVHDDQIGPYARMEFDGEIIQNSHKNERNSLSTSWVGDDGVTGSVRALPEILLIPLYHKIRIPYGTIHDLVVAFNEFIISIKSIASLNSISPIPFGEPLEWDIYLTDVNTIKNQLLCNSQYKGEYYQEVLLENMPKYIWQATALMNDSPVLDLIFDATDIEHGQMFVRAIEHDTSFGRVIKIVSRVNSFTSNYEKSGVWKIIKWFKERKI